MGPLLLLGAALLLFSCPCHAMWAGKEFALSFLQNYKPNYDTPSFQLHVTAVESQTKVTVDVPSLKFREEKNLKAGEGVTIRLPNKVELDGTGKSANTVRIEATALVTVTSFNYKLYTADTSVILPTTEWGTEYFIFTPLGTPYQTYKEFSVTNGKESNRVEISLNGALHYEGRVYRPGSQLVIDLQPFESVQLQSTDDLSGSRITSTKPVAVYSGHSCTWRFSKCNHVYEQLFPVSKWGTDFLVPPLSVQNQFDSVYIQASQNTRVTVQTDKGKDVCSLKNGETKEIQYHEPTTLSIQADHAIQVFLLFNGATEGYYKFYDPFLTNIVPTNHFCSSYALQAMPDFDNQALIVAKTSEMLALKIDGVVPRDVQWKRVEGTDYSWAQISYNPTRDGSSHTVSSSGSAFGLYSFGLSQMNGYGAPGQCIQSGSSGGGSLSCDTITCSANEVCKMSGGYPTCVTKPKKPGTCWAMGDPHYNTFDGRRYNFMGTCTYVIAKNCKASDNLPEFEILAQNENRGSPKVSYVGLVIVKVYEVTIIVARSETGYVRIDNTRWALPVTMNSGKLIILQSGRSVVIETDFGLAVRYDWEHSLVVTLSDIYSGKTCGLCGNFNGNPSDDFATPSGSPVDSAVAFGGSWKVPGLVQGALCRDDCVGGCEKCEHNLMKMWEGDLFCGIITLVLNGPFSKCHGVIDPQAYFESCKYDVCMGGGLRHFLCKALEAYTDACQSAGVEVHDWRKMAKCPAKCPANSHYELCGSACPATCSDPDAPTKCNRPCVETCACNKGFFLSGNKCVRSQTCGCTYNGRYIPAGESFWADQGCQKFCKCDPKSQKVECKDKGCRKGEICQVVDGIRKCASVSVSTCQATGDPHYKTFDGRKFDFQGTCVYQLAALCSKDPDLVPFEVIVQNDHRGSRTVSYTKLVEVKVYSLSIIITRTHKGKILLNNELVNLPISLQDGEVNVYKSGWYAVVQANFGLKVTFNWESAVFVTLPSNYMGAVCGLCGNYNGKPQDDLIPKNGDTPVKPADFGMSWRVAEIPGCVEGCKGNCPDCDINQKVLYEKDDFCGIIRNPKGPFRDCHAKVDPAGYFEDCVYDVCLYNGRNDVLCQAITAYTSACQDVGAKVYSWRTRQFCAIKCPVHSHYEICAVPCPATCQSLTPPPGCQAFCEEGCTCDEGYIFSGDTCVPFSQCGCVHEERYYSIGQVFYPNGECQEECKCGQDGEVECKKFSCGPNEKCTIENGIQKCHPVGKGVCRGSGDPHYSSFDGKKFDFQGTCTYTLSQSCGLEGTHLEPFSVQVENVEWNQNNKVSVTKLVALNVYGITFIMRNNMFGILVNGIFNYLPLNIKDGAVLVFQEGTHYVIETDFGLRVSYNLIYHVVVTVPGNYRNKVCGLCGNFNDDPKDDFQLPNKQLTNNVNDFGKSWKVTIPNVVCSNGCEGNNCPNCDSAHKTIFSKPTYCGIVTDPKGPFAACHSILNPQPYFDDCVFDVCVSNGEGKVLCDSVAAYAYNCHMAGVDVKSWRSPSFCPMKCPANSHYEVCADSCSAACPGLTEIVSCKEGSCTEGCECDTGFLFNGQTCVKDAECGCYDEGRTYKPGEVVYNEDCTSKCRCDPTTGLVCESHSCPQGTKCAEKKGIQGCYNTDPCKDAKCRVKEKCRVEKGEAVCVPEYTGVCWAWGDPHYHTFDNYNFDFQGTCRYVISQTCGDLDGLVPFSISEINDNRGNKAVSYVREVEVSVYGYSIIVRKNQVGQVTVDGELLNLPVSLAEGDRVVSVVQHGHIAKIETDFGLSVTYDWNWELVIRLPSTYYNLVCGLCGNFNGNSRDELQNPAGKAVSSVIEWGKSWQTAEQDKDSPCWDTCVHNCPTCDGDQRKLYETEAFCGALTAKANSVFQKCHDKVDPDAFMNSCVYDMCLNNGDKKMLCQALASYSQHCREQGIIIKNWRKKFDCPMNCQRNSHFEDCASPCQPSCPFPEQKQACTEACVETCVCDKGYVLSAGVCVPAKTCGCSYQGRYYKPGQSFWEGEGCGRLCECDTTLGMVICKEASCSANEKCSVVDGVRACRPISHATCTASGDPHYRSFDGRKFDFQGTCVYQLVALCSEQPDLVPFKVTVQNDHRGNKAVSFTRTVTLTIYDVTITISREYPNKVLLNGQLALVPLVVSDELMVSRSGHTAVVETAAGITVTFDWSSTVSVTLPSNYQGAVCGLCGNYNGKAQDDLTMRNGQAAPDGVKLGESWQVALVPGCSSVCQGPWCHACTDSQREVYRAQKYCGIIADKAGPFKDCHSRVDPVPYLEDCVFDACQYNGHHGSVCDAIKMYVSVCQSFGIAVRSWRTETFCPMVCPANSHYTLCATGCPATCASLTSLKCNRPCTETCECDEGFLLSGGVCVPVKDCGCSYDGRYYRIGDSFYPENECVEKCTCGENGAVSCQKAVCRPGEICKVVNGVKSCHPEGQGKCVASGDPHYISFDGQRFDFQGTCLYVLAKVCDDDKGQLTPFTVTQGNEKYGNGKVAVTKSVGVEVYGFVIYIQQGVSWKVIVNDELFNLPLSMEDDRIIITQEGRNIVLRTDFGLMVLYDTVYYVEVIVPSTYMGKMCGLCGNYNKNSKDDFRLPDGKQNNNVDVFGKAWVVDLPGFVCGGCGGECPVCDQAKAALFGKPELCGIMSAPNGPFKACHSKIDPAAYVSHCVFDVCAMAGNKDTLCDSVQAYALACQSAGVQIQSWRTDSFCPASCPQHSHYELCADACGMTCASLMYPVRCSETCFEGCQCDDGFIFDGIQCVSMDNCGCELNGRYLTVGQTVVDPHCQSKCVCQASGTVQCEKLSCGGNEVCEVRDGVRGCHVKQGKCTVDQAAQLTSFDGMSGPMGGLGAFEVASLCDVTAELWFRVVVDVRACRKGASSVDTVYVFFKDATIALNSHQTAWVNGRKVSLPGKVGSEIAIRISDRSILIERASAVRVTYSISQEVTVIVDSSLSYKMCGACGNYNNNSKDDMTTADGKTTTDVSVVVGSWRADDFSSCGLL